MIFLKNKRKGLFMKKILLKGEPGILQHLMESSLKKHHIEVVLAHSDHEMFEVLKEQKIDLVIYDVKTSYSTFIFNEIKEKYPKVKITVSSANDHQVFYVNLIKLDMYPFVKMPFTEVQFLETINHYLPEEALKRELKMEDFKEVQYKKNKNGEIDGIYFEYSSRYFKVVFNYEENEIEKVYIEHGENIVFSCPGCAKKSPFVGVCEEFSKRQEEILSMIFEDKKIKNECEDLILKWESYTKKQA